VNEAGGYGHATGPLDVNAKSMLGPVNSHIDKSAVCSTKSGTI
jgi:hypothetical protein